jgi:hypothetical protein
MPKPTKTKPKQKPKAKPKVETETPGITTKKSYWITLTLLLVVVTAVSGSVLGMDLLKTAMLMATIAVLIGFAGYIRVSHSTLSLSKRATFIFVGASVIGFGIWAVTALALMPQIVVLNDDFFVIASLVICLTAGAFIGELLGKNRKVQERLFPQNL